MSSAGTLAGMGLGNSGVRQIAASSGNPETLARVRSALWIGNLTLGFVAALLLWLFQGSVAEWVLNDSSRSADVAWLGLGVLLTLVASSQTALLQGLRRIGDLALVSILGSLLGATVGIAAVWWMGEKGVIAFLLMGPATSVLVAAYYTRNLSAGDKLTLKLTELLPEWRSMFLLGAVFMLTALMTELTQLTIRAMITSELGINATGQFQASWAISMQYISFVLGAMAADYYPRLTESINDRGASNSLVAQQVEFSLLLAAPVIMAMMALAPWIIKILYSKEFADSVSILRWQIMGDIFKIASWPLGFILVARAEKGLFFFTQTLWLSAYLLLIWIGLPLFGLEITGIAFLVCYVIGFAANCLIAWRVNGFTYGENTPLLIAIVVLCAFIMLLSAWDDRVSAVAGTLLALGMGVYTLRRMAKQGAFGGLAGKIQQWLRR
jgi:PST family polysaccharide transporter